MPSTKVIKPKPVETTSKRSEKPKPMKVKATEGELKVPAVRKSRASSYPRRPQWDRSDGTLAGAQGAASKARSRSNSTGPKLNGAKTNPGYRKDAGVNPKCREPMACPVQRDQRGIRAEAKYGSQR